MLQACACMQGYSRPDETNALIPVVRVLHLPDVETGQNHCLVSVKTANSQEYNSLK